ncbi:hypothetical protein SAMN06295920_104367 [Rhizorhabdus histidinilytica]|uniref:Uncharacterized protein n=1 Tax=Rhizorhabdus histidinilytica TaxID=439228 RepID=A0A1T5CWR0_9SPHN|nr:hypothetical protein SAMN06295920_104367 [Rhizorhabdus histidinilytica]
MTINGIAALRPGAESVAEDARFLPGSGLRLRKAGR